MIYISTISITTLNLYMYHIENPYTQMMLGIVYLDAIEGIMLRHLSVAFGLICLISRCQGLFSRNQPRPNCHDGNYTGWPRKNATPMITNFKEIRDKIKLVSAFMCRKILFAAK